jgi:hypothetical protein
MPNIAIILGPVPTPASSAVSILIRMNDLLTDATEPGISAK